MLFFPLGQGAARILSLRGLPRRHTVKTDGPVPPGYVLAATVLGISQICGVASLPGWEGAPVETEHGGRVWLRSTGPDRSDRPML